VPTRAYLRSVTNVGVAVGAAGAALALQLDTRGAYWTVLVLDGLTFMCAATVMRRLPEVTVTPFAGPTDGQALGVLQDRRYVAMSSVNVLLLLHVPLIEVVLPLWVTLRTQAPKWMVSIILIVNTLTVVLLQVRMTRNIGSPLAALAALRRAGLWLCVACAGFALAAAVSRATAVALLAAAAVFHVLGEMLHASASWNLSYGLAPPGRTAEYQAFFNSGHTVASTLAPAALVLLLVEGSALGWLLLGGLFLLAPQLMRVVVLRQPLTPR